MTTHGEGKTEIIDQGEGSDAKLRVLESSLRASTDLLKTLDSDCPVRAEVLALLVRALALVSGALVVLVLVGYALSADSGFPLVS
jgi:hypothetical protein